MPNNSIVMCEPYCWGFEHSSFNAALLRSLQLAYPSSLIYFLGEKTHLENVKSVLETHGVDTSAITWHELKLYRRNAVKWKRIVNDIRWVNTVLRLSTRLNTRLLCICSINNIGILTLKLMMHAWQTKGPAIAIPHSCLASIPLSGERFPWSIKKAIALCPPENLKLIALGESIYHEVINLVPRRKSQWEILDHPYLWPSIGNDLKPDEGGIRFGFFGAANAGKGFDSFCTLADHIAAEYSQTEFLLVGFYWGFDSNSIHSPHVKGISSTPLTPDEFQERAREITYSIWLADPDHYRLTASATFLDALAYAKPGIYLRNPFVEHYFNIMGDIGYLCDSYDEIVRTVKQVINNFPHQRYEQQVKNILNGREIFSPEILAKKIRVIGEDKRERH